MVGAALKAALGGLVAVVVAMGCVGSYRFGQKMDALIGQDFALLTDAWGPPHETVPCRQHESAWGRAHTGLQRRACEWAEQGKAAYIWTLIQGQYDSRQSTEGLARVVPSCSVIVVVSEGRIEAWEVAPYQQCRDYRAVDTVPAPPPRPR